MLQKQGIITVEVEDKCAQHNMIADDYKRTSHKTTRSYFSSEDLIMIGLDSNLSR